MPRMTRVRAAALAAALIAAPVAALAQGVQSIAAIVNDDVISMFDLKSRIDLVVASGRLPDNVEMRQRIAPQVLRSLIDERLQLQEAKRRNITVTKSEIDLALGDIERDNGLPKGGLKQLLREWGVHEDSLAEQLRANIAWQKLIRRQYRPTVNITSEEVDEALARIKASQGKEEVLLAEIVLSVDSVEEETTVRENAQRLVEQLHAGGAFDALARQFSQGATAAVGGDLGWVRPDEMDPALGAAVAQLRPGQVSDPVRTLAGFHIVGLRDRRLALTADPSRVRVSIDQIFLPASTGDAAARLDQAKKLRETVKGCADMAAAAKEVRSTRPAHLGTFQLKDLSAEMRQTVLALKVGELSEPVRLPDGLMLLMVCERDDPAPALPSREQVENGLLVQRLNMLSRRHLRDLRLASIVDVRV